MNELAARYGIEESFHDARGIDQITSPATRRALLAAMGVDAQSEEAAFAALETLDRDEWSRPLPPVHVALQTSPISLAVTLSARTEWLQWQVTLENGEQRNGVVQFPALLLQQRRDIEGEVRERRILVLGEDVPMGYHQLSISAGGAPAALIVVPAQCWLPADIEQGARVWGVAAQLYLIKSKCNWGIGDFSDLRRLAQMLVPLGANAIGLNPLHAMFVDNPEHASPYSPASRLLLNALNIDVRAALEGCPCAAALARIQTEEFQRALQACRASDLVDYAAVARLKFPILRMIFKSSNEARDCAQWREFEAFRQAAGETFERSCLFLALREYFAERTPSTPDWRDWPSDYRDPHSPKIRMFAKDEHARVTFQTWLQFIAERQLAEAAKTARPMAIGLYRDLAVGADPSGAETWSNQRAVITHAQVGVPPDIYNPAGQDWGLPPFHPKALRSEAYRSFIDLLRANMRHAGGLRIDHVMALQQLYWIPRGSPASQGAYVRYPLEELIGIVALESHRNQCLIVGEDLGTVPAGFRERMMQARILSYRVLFFEKGQQGFVTPPQYPQLSLAVAGSHDLPTLRAWWTASDLALKDELGLFPSAKDKKDADRDRVDDRQQILRAFRQSRLPNDPAMSLQQFADAAHAYLACSAATLAMVQLDDITEETTPVNVPATSREHPNWRRRLAMSLEQVAEHVPFRQLAQVMNDARRPRISSL